MPIAIRQDLRTESLISKGMPYQFENSDQFQLAHKYNHMHSNAEGSALQCLSLYLYRTNIRLIQSVNVGHFFDTQMRYQEDVMVIIFVPN